MAVTKIPRPKPQKLVNSSWRSGYSCCKTSFWPQHDSELSHFRKILYDDASNRAIIMVDCYEFYTSKIQHGGRPPSWKSYCCSLCPVVACRSRDKLVFVVHVQISADGLTGKIRFDSNGVRYGHSIQLIVTRSTQLQQVAYYIINYT